MQNTEYDNIFNKAYEERTPDFDKNINIAVIGKVSSGKSSLINSLMERDRSEPIAKVGATSGITTKVTSYKLSDNVLIVDCPGLQDVRAENSQETKKFLESIDLGILVVTGSADSSQRELYFDLRKTCKHVLVVLNKIDEWDELEESEYLNVKKQWQSTLDINHIYGVCTKGYDPKMKQSAPMDIRGVDELRDQVFHFLKNEGKDHLLAKHLKNKDKYAIGIISTALISVAGEAFIPGSAAYITATQAAAITSIYYLYTGKVLTKSSTLALLPTFAGQSLGSTIFLWAKSILPPTGVVDIAAATVAVTVTFSMLSAVRWLLVNGYNLEDKDVLIEAFDKFKKLSPLFKGLSISDFKNLDKIKSIIAEAVTSKLS